MFLGFVIESTPKLLFFIAQTKGLVSATRCRCEVASVRQCFPKGIVRCRCEVASARQCFPNGIASARRRYAHLRHRCEVASALQCFPNGIVSARGRYALICVTGAKWHLPCNAFQMGSYLQEDAMLSSASQVRSGICPAMLSKWDRICKRMLRSSASQICNKM